MTDTLCPKCGAYWSCDCVREPDTYDDLSEMIDQIEARNPPSDYVVYCPDPDPGQALPPQRTLTTASVKWEIPADATINTAKLVYDLPDGWVAGPIVSIEDLQ